MKGTQMLQSFLSVFATAVGSKKILAGWLVLLTLALAQVGEKVYVDRTAQLAIVETKLDTILDTVKKIESTTDENAAKLTNILVEQATVRAELAAHEEANAKELATIRKYEMHEATRQAKKN